MKTFKSETLKPGERNQVANTFSGIEKFDVIYNHTIDKAADEQDIKFN